MFTVLSPYIYRVFLLASRTHVRVLFKESFFEIHLVKIGKCPYLGEAICKLLFDIF